MTASTIDQISETLLMGPGPSCIHPDVYKAIGHFTIGHLDPRFVELMDQVKERLQKVIGTNNRLTIPVSGTGSSGMETCLVNLLERNDRILILINGVFGMRMKDLATRLGAQVDTLEFEWGTPVEVRRVKEKLAGSDYAMVAVVHAETSTGVCNPVEEIGGVVRDTGALFFVDTVTSLGGMPVAMDEWGIDALFSGTQKCLSCPPGLAPVSFSERALEKLQNRTTPVPSWYFDLTMITKYWEGAKRVYHHTAPVNMIYALHAALGVILDEGLQNVYDRHRRMHQKLVEGLGALGLSMLVEEQSRLPMLNAVTIPEGIDEAQVRGRLLKEFDIEIGAGLGPLAGKIWRIGLMGHTAYENNVQRLLSALKTILGK